jgi:hypothetical protein
MVFHLQLMMKMTLQKVNPFLEYVEQNNEIFVQIFEEHVELIVDNQHDQLQSNNKQNIPNPNYLKSSNKLHSILFQRMISCEVKIIPDQSNHKKKLDN